MFTDRYAMSKNTPSHHRIQTGSYGELDSLVSLPSKQILKTISSPQIIIRKNQQQQNYSKQSVKLTPLPLHQIQKNNNNQLNGTTDLRESQLFGGSTNKSFNPKSDQRISIDDGSSVYQKNVYSKEFGEVSQNEIDSHYNQSPPNSKKYQTNNSNNSNMILNKHTKQNTETSVLKKNEENQKNSILKSQHDESLLENPSYYKLFETNKRITLQNQKREDALNELISYIQSFLAQAPGQQQKDATTISEALNHLMITIESAQKNEMELNKAMREMHKQLKDNLKLQMESEIYKNQTRLGTEELFLYKQKHDGAQQDIRQLKKENIQLTHFNDELRRKNQTYEKRLELLSDYQPDKKGSVENQFNGNNNESLMVPTDNNQSYEHNNSSIKKSSQDDIKSMSKFNDKGGEKSTTLQKGAPALYKNGQMQTVLADLVKENENYKKQLKQKDKEIERLKELNYKQQDKMNRLYKKIDMIKMKRTNKDEENKNNNSNAQEDKFNFEKNELPLTADFKVQNISLRSQNFLSDLQEQGKESYLSQFEDDKKDQIELIISQLSSYREFSEKINSMIHEVLYLVNFTSINEIMIYISRNFKQHFQAENVHLWVREAETGILRTFNQQGKELRALTTKGIFHKCIDQEKIINYCTSKEVTLYQNTDGNLVCQDKCVVFPIFLQNSSSSNSQSQYLVGVFEVSQLFNERMELDEQYQSIFLSKVLRYIFKKIHENTVLSSQLKSADMNQEFFQDLCTSKSKFQFGQIIKKWASAILQSSAAQFIFVEQDKILLYKSDTETKSVSSSISLASLIIANKKSMIFYDSGKQVEFQQDIDIQSILPIYYHPIILDFEENPSENRNDESVKFDDTKSKHVVGVIQFVIKSKKRITSMPVNEIMMLDQGLLSQDIDYKCFCQYIQSAYELLFCKK